MFKEKKEVEMRTLCQCSFCLTLTRTGNALFANNNNKTGLFPPQKH